MNFKSKLFAGAVAVAMVLSVAPFVASAQTTAELTAQINSLLAMIAQLQAQVAAGSTTSTGSTTTTTTFTAPDLTVGSTGAQVSALQQFLVSKGFLTMPAGVAYGYFGGLTKAALAAYQASVGITPAVGYFGPITRAKVNVTVTTTTTTTTTTTAGCVAGALYSATTGALCSTNVLPAGCTVGAAFSSTTGASCSTGVSAGVITTPGVEGTLAVSSNNSGLVSTVYAGDSMDAILGFNVEAKTSDIAIQRIKLDIGDSTKIYNKGYTKMYVTDGSNVLASSDLNSGTVVKSGSEYYITFTGFNYVVPKNTKKQLVIKADAMSSIDTADLAALSLIPVRLALDGVRGIDGAGIDQYAGDTSISRTVTFSASLSDNAALKISLNGSSPDTSSLVASDGSANNELDLATVLVFDAKAEKDNATITDLTLTIATTSSASTAALFPTFYLYDGSTQIDSVSQTGSGSVSFHDLTLNVSKDSTKTFTIKTDVRSAGVTSQGLRVTVASAAVAFENTVGDSFNSTGSATGRYVSFTSAGAQVTLTSKSGLTTGAPEGTAVGYNYSTSTLTATFNVKVKASGSDLVLGNSASTSPLFATSTTYMKVYRNGTSVNNNAAVSFSIPSTCVVSGNNCTLSDGNEVTIPVTFIVYGRTAAGASIDAGLYSVGLEGLHVFSDGAYQDVLFMAGLTDWRTNELSFP